jgi:homoserine dehydrogenase
VLADITCILAELEISIDAMIQKEPKKDEEQVDIIVLTHLSIEKNINAAITRIEQLSSVMGKITRIRLEELSSK